MITVHYNGACSICGPEVQHYMRQADKHGVSDIGFSDISSPNSGSAEELERYGISPQDAARSFTAVTRDGQVLRGVDAFIALWQRLPRYRWLARFVSLPIVRPVGGLVYDKVLAPILFQLHLRRLRRASAPD